MNDEILTKVRHNETKPLLESAEYNSYSPSINTKNSPALYTDTEVVVQNGKIKSLLDSVDSVNDFSVSIQSQSSAIITDVKQESSTSDYSSSHYEEKIVSTENVDSKKRRKFTRRQILILLLGIYGNFWIATCYSLIAPFFPQEAKKKGASSTIYGFIFGIFQLTVFITSPIYGKMIPTVSIKFLVVAGMFVSGSCSMLFGVLVYSPNGFKFIILAFFVRIVEALGSSAYFVSALTMVAMEFPENKATVLSILESATGVGMIVGPTIGGVLYQAGGYILPFVTLGGVILLGTIISIFIIPSSDYQGSSSGGFSKLMKQPSFYSFCSVFVYSAILIGFNDATLSDHLQKFKLKPALIGVIFTVPAAVYAIGTPILGVLCDKFKTPYLFCVVGTICCTIAFLFIGPAPFLKLKITLWLVIVSLVIFGIGVSGMLVTSFIICLTEAVKRGLPDDTSTYAIISGIFSSALSLGAFIGPSVGGVILDNIGYENGTIIIMGLSCLMTVVVFLNCACSYSKTTGSDEERQPIFHA